MTLFHDYVSMHAQSHCVPTLLLCSQKNCMLFMYMLQLSLVQYLCRHRCSTVRNLRETASQKRPHSKASQCWLTYLHSIYRIYHI